MGNPTLPGQPQQVIPSHRGAFAAHIHVMLSHRSVAERQVECGRQSPTPILPETPCESSSDDRPGCETTR